MSAGAQVVRVRPARSGTESESEDLPQIRLRHGQAVWLLSEMGFQGAASAKTFYEYVKSLRKLGLPFPRGGRRKSGSRLATYGYEHLMELALALSLRVYHGLPDAVLVELIRHRTTLNALYRDAYVQRSGGLGARLFLKGPTNSFDACGTFLDLQINYNGGTLASFGPPRLLSPLEAIEIYATSPLAARALLPLRLSDVAEQVVELSARAPSIRDLHSPTGQPFSARRSVDPRTAPAVEVMENRTRTRRAGPKQGHG